MLYSWQWPFTLKQDDLWTWRPETLPVSPTHFCLSLQVPEAGAVAFPWGRGVGLGLGLTGAQSPSPIPFHVHSGHGIAGGTLGSQSCARWVQCQHHIVCVVCFYFWP